MVGIHWCNILLDWQHSCEPIYDAKISFATRIEIIKEVSTYCNQVIERSVCKGSYGLEVEQFSSLHEVERRRSSMIIAG